MAPSMEYIAGRGGISDAVVVTFSEHEDHQRPKAVLCYVTPIINYLPTHQRGRNHHLVVVAHAY